MTELPVTMECAGNGGPNSVIGGIGCISTAVWRGARLRDVLQLAGVHASGQEVVATGVDRGHDPDDPVSPGFYARSIPIEKALDPATLVALYMNREVLPPAHGYPARLIVPGWYGVDSVKWLASLRVITRAFDRTGQAQPLVPAAGQVYEANWVQPVAIEVEPGT